MDYLERAKLINKVIEDGHEIIDRMRLISKSSELEELKPIIDKYADFVDENFGEPSDLDDEKECSLTTSLYVALDWKRKSLYPENLDYEPTQVLAKEFMDGFIRELDDESWT
ncbi:hypothetical protein HG471_001365 [Candidatus Saccharibacteria bacterium]|jgi:hypothetical protein|nr:hypothetical protein [Candidatus Saccharibacteria bacterium]